MHNGGKRRTSLMNRMEKDVFFIDLSLTSRKCYMSYFHVLFLSRFFLDDAFISYQSVKSFIHKFKGFSETEFSRLKTSLVNSGLIFEVRGSANRSFLLVNPLIREELEEVIFHLIGSLLSEVIAIIEGPPESDEKIETLLKKITEKVESMSFDDTKHLFSYLLSDLNEIASLEYVRCRNKGKLYFIFSLDSSTDLSVVEKEIRAVLERIFMMHFDAGVDVTVETFWRGGKQLLDVEVDFCKNKEKKSVWRNKLVLLLESLKKSILH